MPEKVATHWNLRGEANGWMSRKYMIFGIVQGIQIMLYGMMLGIRWLILQLSNIEARKKNDGINPLKERETILNIGLVDRIMALTIGFIGSVHLFVIFHAMYAVGIGAVTFVLLPLFLIIVVVMIMRTMNTANKIREEMAAAGVLPPEVVAEYRRHWKWGMFYVNPNDKSVFVSNRLGMGFTLNLAHPMSWVVLLLLLLPAFFILGFAVTR